MQFHVTAFSLTCFNFTCCLFKMQCIFPSLKIREKNLLTIHTWSIALRTSGENSPCHTSSTPSNPFSFMPPLNALFHAWHLPPFPSSSLSVSQAKNTDLKHRERNSCLKTETHYPPKRALQLLPPQQRIHTGKGSAPSWMTKPSMMCVSIWGLTMACGGLESPIWRDTIARLGVGAEVGVIDVPSLEVVFGIAVAAGSDLSGILTA